MRSLPLERLLLLPFSLLLFAGLALPASAQLHFTRVVTGLTQPLYVTEPPGDPRLFAVERGGTIRIVTDPVPGAPFLDITGKVTTASGEQGLLGLAFAPDYATSGHFYVNYTRASDGATVVSRFLRSTPDLADSLSETVLLVISQPDPSHNGGHLAFGPDDMLYIAVGEGGDPTTGQNLMTPLGSMLRVDLSEPDLIPVDNPDLGAGSDPLIWSYGLRNPFRFSFDRLTGDLFIGDVGGSAQEEVNFQPATSPGGENYGWSILEGSLCHDPPTGCSAAGTVLPAIEIDHGGGGAHAVIGGYVYRGSLPSLQGVYIYADFLLPFFTARQGPTGVFQYGSIGAVTDAGVFNRIASFGEDAAGEIYVVDYTDGEIYRLDGRDLDGDGLLDDADNCPGVVNLDQADLDENGVGDVCEYACSDGLDNDGDGRIDFDPLTYAAPGNASTPPAGVGDPGCSSPSWFLEAPGCQDGIDNDGDGGIDYDAGLSANGFVHAQGADPHCGGRPWRSSERRGWIASSCGLGFELALWLPILAALRGRRLRGRHR